MKRFQVALLGLALVVLVVAAGSAAAGSGYTVSNDTPGFIKKATDNGAADPSQTITVTVWLNLQNQSKLDQLVRDQQAKGSPNYHKWLNQSDFNATYAPTSQEVKSITNFLGAHGITVGDVAENNFYVNATGTIGNIEKAFHVQIDSYTYDGQTYFSNTADPNVNDSSGAHVAAITGLDNFGAQPSVAWPDGSPQYTPLSSGSNGILTPSNCFSSGGSATFTNPVPASYSGNQYGAAATPFGPCGYQPSELHTAYNTGPLYASGLDGTGQTVVIVDAFGSPTIEQDAQAFSQIYGLPPVDLTISRAPGVWRNSSPHLDAAGWSGETTLDVEWVHAMAPGAKIDLVVGPTDTGSLDEAINYAVVHHLGNVVSNSWSNFEGLGNPAKFDRDQRILEQAMAEGIDVNFSTGDWGDNSFLFGQVAPSFPADSPFATAIGGTSLALNAANGIDWQTGWGTDLTRLFNGSTGNDVDPMAASSRLGFQYGTGGGFSLNFAKPSWQTGTPGTTRAFPDISMDADPYTGVEIIQTVGGNLSLGVIGGTSLSCPLFSGLAAIASQKAGHGLGQVAPLLYGLSGISDVTQKDGSPNNVSGVYNGTPLTADQLAAPPAFATLPSTYYSALYHSPFSHSWFVLDFGVDAGLLTTSGWDDTTGLGSPNDANAFVNALATAAG